jgi:hypothetical protein
MKLLEQWKKRRRHQPPARATVSMREQRTLCTPALLAQHAHAHNCNELHRFSYGTSSWIADVRLLDGPSALSRTDPRPLPSSRLLLPDPLAPLAAAAEPNIFLVIEGNFNVIWICLTQFELMELMCDEFLQILSEKEDFVLPSYKLTKWSRDTETGTSEMQRRKQLHSTESSDSKGLQWKQGIWWCSAGTEHNRIGPSQSTTLLQ